jgi:hypothetical protein
MYYLLTLHLIGQEVNAADLILRLNSDNSSSYPIIFNMGTNFR